MVRPIPSSRDEDIDALGALCDQLAAFGEPVATEYVDGYFTAALAGRRPVTLDQAIPKVFDDAFERAFADPEAAAAPREVLAKRWRVLEGQLDAESLVDEPDRLRLEPIMMVWDDEARAEALAEIPEAERDEASEALHTGGYWAVGFLAALDDFPEAWPDVDDEDAWRGAPEAAEMHEELLARIALLQVPQDEARKLADEIYRSAETLERDDLIDGALFAVQELKVLALDFAPKPEQRRVAPQPGRNDPCPCGSGKKFKKCHGVDA